MYSFFSLENLVKDEENTEAKESFDKNSTNTDKYSCDICQKLFITKSRLSTHKRTHDSKRNKSKSEAKKINSEKSTVRY